MDKTDFRKTLKHLYQPKAKDFVLVDVPVMQFIKIDGDGGPESPDYITSIQWLYTLSYSMKFVSKQKLGKDFVVPPLEGLWWAHDLNAFVDNDKTAWLWTMMIMQPDWITPEMFAQAIEKARAKLGAAPLSLRLEPFDEGMSVQILHVGPYSEEAPTIAKLHEHYLPENGLTESGHHHEVYLNDPRRTAPEKLKTVLRQPVRKLG